jgi:hypothetical protein
MQADWRIGWLAAAKGRAWVWTAKKNIGITLGRQKITN